MHPRKEQALCGPGWSVVHSVLCGCQPLCRCKSVQTAGLEGLGCCVCVSDGVCGCSLWVASASAVECDCCFTHVGEPTPSPYHFRHTLQHATGAPPPHHHVV